MDYKEKNTIIFTGTNTENVSGGIGFVISDYFEAVKTQNIIYDFIPTYVPKSIMGKFLPWFKGLFRIGAVIIKIRGDGYTPVVYSHAGNAPSIFRESIILFIARLFGGRTILHIHSPRLNFYLGHFWTKLFIKCAFSSAELVVVLTPWWRERIQQTGINSIVSVVANPLSPRLVSIAKDFSVIPSKKNGDVSTIRIVTMARLVPGKGGDVILKALQYLPDNVTLEIAGDGSEKKGLEHYARMNNLEKRVTFLGWIGGEEKEAALRRADLFCLPSVNDVFPMSFVEAMCYGLPVVAVKWAGIPDVVMHDRTGILVADPDPIQVANAVMTLLSSEKRYTMGLEAKKWIVELSSPETVGKKIMQCLKHL